MAEARPNGSARFIDVHIEQLGDVNRRLSELQGEAKHFATKEDVANAKFQMVTAWAGALLSLFFAVAMVIVRFWPT